MIGIIFIQNFIWLEKYKKYKKYKKDRLSLGTTGT
jgi:hypothetical protein